MHPLRSAADSPGRGTQAALTARGTHVRVNSGGEYQSRLPERNIVSATRPAPQISGAASSRVRASPSVLSLIGSPISERRDPYRGSGTTA